MPARGKVNGTYVNSALAKSDAMLSGFDEAIVLNQDGHVSEGSAANFMMIRHGQLITPPVTSNLLEGITRRTVLQLAADELGLTVIERNIDRSELYIADEAFFLRHRGADRGHRRHRSSPGWQRQHRPHHPATQRHLFQRCHRQKRKVRPVAHAGLRSIAARIFCEQNRLPAPNNQKHTHLRPAPAPHPEPAGASRRRGGAAGIGQYFFSQQSVWEGLLFYLLGAILFVRAVARQIWPGYTLTPPFSQPANQQTSQPTIHPLAWRRNTGPVVDDRRGRIIRAGLRPV
jgi:hypothetical protein